MKEEWTFAAENFQFNYTKILMKNYEFYFWGDQGGHNIYSFK